MTLPFDGAISDYFETGAPDDVRAALKTAGKSDILTPTYPHRERMKRKDYERQIQALQIELVKLQAWAKETGARVASFSRGAMRRAKAARSNAFAKT